VYPARDVISGWRGDRVYALSATTEALTNVLRHADCERAELSLQVVDGALVLDVRDEGSGFELEGAAANGCWACGNARCWSVSNSTRPPRRVIAADDTHITRLAGRSTPPASGPQR
jgi:hypothetical protein